MKERLQTVTLPEDHQDDDYVPSIINTQVIASYSWTDAGRPTILVPGTLPVWRERSFPYSLEPDQGVQYIDQNAHRSKIHPMLPLVLSVRHISPKFDYSKIDVITDRNGLRKLMRWVDTTETTRTCENFRIDIDVVGKDKNTVLFTRWEPRDYEEQRIGYGHSFEKATTSTPQHREGATGYTRIIQYDFAGLTLLVRYSVDATLPVTKRTVAAPKLARRREDDVDDLSAQIASLSIGASNAATSSRGSEGDIRIISTPHEISPQSSTIELKSRSVRSYESFDWRDTLPQLFFSQTPYLYIGIHQKGTFERVVKCSMPVSLRWDADGKATGDAIQADTVVQRALDNAGEAVKKLGLLLERLRDVALEQAQIRSGNSGMVLLCESGKLSLHRREDRLPPQVSEAFN